MEKEQRQSKRMMALMPEEEPVCVRTESKSYPAKLVNLGAGGALISILECRFREEIGTRCVVSFVSAGQTFEVHAELLRVIGWYAALKFVDLTPEQSEEIAAKMDHMETLTQALCPVLEFGLPSSNSYDI
ncbi:MAG: PilZ domain-containing protein [Acidobacteria bacterium]|nr:PilZ domain-containing protein [Acidobacteriota bacterium]